MQSDQQIYQHHHKAFLVDMSMPTHNTYFFQKIAFQVVDDCRTSECHRVVMMGQG